MNGGSAKVRMLYTMYEHKPQIYVLTFRLFLVGSKHVSYLVEVFLNYIYTTGHCNLNFNFIL